MPLVEGEASMEAAGAVPETAEALSAAAVVDVPPAPARELSLSVLDTYKIMLEIMRLPAVRHYIALLIVVKVLVQVYRRTTIHIHVLLMVPILYR